MSPSFIELTLSGNKVAINLNSLLEFTAEGERCIITTSTDGRYIIDESYEEVSDMLLRYDSTCGLIIKRYAL